MTEIAAASDLLLTGTDVLRWYVEQGGSYSAAAEAMASDLAAAWAEVEEVRGQIDITRRLAGETVSRGYVRRALPTS